MNKLSYIASGLLLASALSSQDIHIKSGWQLLGTTQDLNVSKFDSTCVDYLWKYDSANATNPWQIHVANGQNYNYTGTTISSLDAGQGYWVKGNGDCNLQINSTGVSEDTISYDLYTSLYKPMMPNLSESNKYFHGSIQSDSGLIYDEFQSMVAEPTISNKLYTIGAGISSIEVRELTLTDINISDKWSYYVDGAEQSTYTDVSTITSTGYKITETTTNNVVRTLKFSKQISIDALEKMFLDIDVNVTFNSDDKAQFRLKHQETITFNAIDLILNESAYLKVKAAYTGTSTITHNGLMYGTIESPFTGRVWLDRNLGASQVCTALDDTACFGDLYQFGRDTDGHEKITSGVTTTKVTDIDNSGDEFVYFDVNNPPFEVDWTLTDTDKSQRIAKWSKTDGSSVCPVGYRVPTETEILNEMFVSESTAIINIDDAYNNFLKIPASGYRIPPSGEVFQGTSAYLWTTSIATDSNDTVSISIDSQFGLNNWATTPSYGRGVRCIQAGSFGVGVKNAPLLMLTDRPVTATDTFGNIITSTNTMNSILAGNSIHFDITINSEHIITIPGSAIVDVDISGDYNSAIDKPISDFGFTELTGVGGGNINVGTTVALARLASNPNDASAKTLLNYFKKYDVSQVMKKSELNANGVLGIEARIKEEARKFLDTVIETTKYTKNQSTLKDVSIGSNLEYLLTQALHNNFSSEVEAVISLAETDASIVSASILSKEEQTKIITATELETKEINYIRKLEADGLLSDRDFTIETLKIMEATASN